MSSPSVEEICKELNLRFDPCAAEGKGRTTFLLLRALWLLLYEVDNHVCLLAPGHKPVLEMLSTFEPMAKHFGVRESRVACASDSTGITRALIDLPRSRRFAVLDHTCWEHGKRQWLIDVLQVDCQLVR